jgi:RNA 2',3'-cyclic 3'-phosphodiesterase
MEDRAERSPAGTIRAFIAIELERDVLKALDRLQSELKRRVRGDPVRWTASSSIHLTLKFLGNVPVDQVPALDAGIERACALFDPFPLSFAHLGCFPNPQRPRVVWVGLESASGVLMDLQGAVETEIAPLGYPTEERGFTPHLTLGRAQRTASTEELRSVGRSIGEGQIGQIASMQVNAVSLMRSELRPTGAVYTCLRAVPLGRRVGGAR